MLATRVQALELSIVFSQFLGEASAPAEPGECAFDDPSRGSLIRPRAFQF